MRILTPVGLILAGLMATAHVKAQEEQADITLVGKGDGPIQVRGEKGQVTETIGQSQLRLNRMPEDVARREAEFRQKRLERAQEIAERRRNAREEEAQRQAQAAAEAKQAAEDEGEPSRSPDRESTPNPPPPRDMTSNEVGVYAREPVDPQLRTPENTGVKYNWPPPRPETP